MNELKLDSVIDPQVKVIEEAIVHGGRKCYRCLRDIETQVVTDYSSEGDGMSIEVDKGHDDDCPVMEA